MIQIYQLELNNVQQEVFSNEPEEHAKLERFCG